MYVCTMCTCVSCVREYHLYVSVMCTCVPRIRVCHVYVCAFSTRAEECFGQTKVELLSHTAGYSAPNAIATETCTSRPLQCPQCYCYGDMHLTTVTVPCNAIATETCTSRPLQCPAMLLLRKRITHRRARYCSPRMRDTRQSARRYCEAN